MPVKGSSVFFAAYKCDNRRDNPPTARTRHPIRQLLRPEAHCRWIENHMTQPTCSSPSESASCLIIRATSAIVGSHPIT